MIQSTFLMLAATALLGATEPAKTEVTTVAPKQPMEANQIQKLAREAKTGQEHLAVAGHWEARAHAFETKAASYERRADELANRKDNNPLRHKWPAMVQAPVDLLRSKAMQARRAASESREMMAKHRNLAEKPNSVAP